MRCTPARRLQPFVSRGACRCARPQQAWRRVPPPRPRAARLSGGRAARVAAAGLRQGPPRRRDERGTVSSAPTISFQTSRLRFSGWLVGIAVPGADSVAAAQPWPRRLERAQFLSVRGLPLALVPARRESRSRRSASPPGWRSGDAAPAPSRWRGRRSCCSAAADVFVYSTPYFPNNRPPGDSTLILAASMPCVRHLADVSLALQASAAGVLSRTDTAPPRWTPDTNERTLTSYCLKRSV